MDELREIVTRMVRQVSPVAGSFFPPAKSEAGSGRWEWNETSPDSPPNISSFFPSSKSETDSSPEFSRSNSDSKMPIFLPATSPKDSPENYEISVRRRSIPSYSIMSIFSPARSEIDSPDNYEIIFRNPSIPSYYHFFPPDRSDTDSYGSSTPMQFSIPSLLFPPNKSETINSSLVINGISLDERILGGIEKMDNCIQAVDILQSNDVADLMFRRTDVHEQIRFNRTLLNFSRAVALGGRSSENLFMILGAYDEMAEAMTLSGNGLEFNQARAMLTGYKTLIDLENKKQSGGISFDERISRGIEIDKCFEAVDILQSNSVVDLMFRCTKVHEEIYFNRTLRTFNQALGRGGGSPENPFKLLDKYDKMAKAMAQLDAVSVICRILTGLRDVVSKTIMPQFLVHPKQKSIIERWESYVREAIFDLGYREDGCWRNLIKSGDTHPLMESGDVHPLTETVMNYMKWIGDHDTQNLFKIGEDDDQLDDLRNHDVNSLKMKSVASQLLLVVNILESNLEKISKLYADSALRCIFLMNNILYMKQKVKDSGLGGLLGDNWVCTRRAEITQYAKSYLRASWTKVLDCLNDRGTPWSSSSKASTMALQERLKNFNACFEKICRVQTAWVVRDAQLREELRISILESVIPAYHSFMGRFGNEVESGGHAEQYIKYTADDLENYLSDLCKGIPRVLRTLVSVQVESGGHAEQYIKYTADENYLSDLFKGIPRILRTLISIKPPVRGRVKRRLFLFNKA